MADLSVIDRFTETFSRYIDSGFGLLSRRRLIPEFNAGCASI